MCGIVNITFKKFVNKKVLDFLLTQSMSRGSDATGICVFDESGNGKILKHALKATRFIKQEGYINLLSGLKGGANIIGHTRLATNGPSGLYYNNQPISEGSFALVQNGIVTNLEELEKKFNKKYALDTYAIQDIFHNEFAKNQSLVKSAFKSLKQIKGENNVIIADAKTGKNVIFTNSGSVFYFINEELFLVASEEAIIKKTQKKFSLKGDILKLKPNHVLIFDNQTFSTTVYEEATLAPKDELRFNNRRVIVLEDEWFESLKKIKRCSKCILPETFPGIAFDEKGVCSSCNNYQEIKLKSKEELESILSKYRRGDGKPDCLLAFSGGRDSSYGLHLLKTKYNMNPVAFSYDWGMVTDIGRRNQARMCGKLGVEHIWVSADIKAKKRYIAQNLKAWIKSPNLGMVPLFMAGDKAFLYHANRLAKENKLNLIIFCANLLEKTEFKAAYSGVKSQQSKSVSILNKLNIFRLLKFYGLQYLKNPKYINSSIVDILFGFTSYYLMKQDFLQLFEYEEWNEEVIDKVLKEEYDWEWNPNFPSSWRIGDGTAPLYNLIYYYINGFTENDTFRSNQIREGVMTRGEALNKVALENQIRYQEVIDYCGLVNIDFTDLINSISILLKSKSKAR